MNEITLDNLNNYVYKVKPEYDDENHSYCNETYCVWGNYECPEGGSIDQIQILIVNVCNIEEHYVCSLNDLNNKFIAIKPKKQEAGN